MAKGYLLSQADHDVLRRMIDWYRKSGMDAEPSQEERPISGAPETYVVELPTEGIPAMAGDDPGSAACELYRIVDGTLSAIGTTRVVYNLSSEVVSGSYALATRTKSGAWVLTNAYNELGTATTCVTGLGGVDFDELSVETDPSYVLSIDSSGCLTKTAVADCPSDTGTA